MILLNKAWEFDTSLFLDVFNYTEALTPQPLTYHLLLNESFEISQEFWNIIQDRPRITGGSVSQSFRNDLLSGGVSILIFLIWIGGLNLASLQSVFKQILNRRLDRCIFFGKEPYLGLLFQQDFIIKLGFKIAITQDKIWVDPVVWNGGRMLRIRRMSEKPWSNFWMGERLRGRHFKIVVFELPPWIYRDTSNLNSAIKMTGSHYKVMVEISQFYNFTFDIDYTGPSAGRRFENGTFVGMMAKLAYPELGYDFSFVQGVFAILHQVWERSSYGQIFGKLELKFVTQHGKRFIPWYAFIQPFQSDVWTWCFITFIFVCIVQFASMFLRHGRRIKPIVYDAGFIIPYAMVLEQGLQSIPKGVRYFSCILLLGATILGTGYKSTLRVNLVFPQKEIIPESFAELIARKDEFQIRIGVLGLEREITKGNKQIAQIGSKLQYINNPDVQSIVKQMFIQESSTAFIFWETILQLSCSKFISLNEKTQGLSYSKDNIYYLPLSPAFTLHSIFADSFFGIYNGVYESGVYEKNTEWAQEDYVKRGRRELREDKESPIHKDLIILENSNELQTIPLTIWNLRVVFGLIPIALICACLLFCIERKRILSTKYF